ncbi:ATPase [Novosphingobium aerophilum]|uniref:ATPase n=1 Tax=Novosphingobium aerophilum TaxID=2839843 RepID=A0A7X1F5L2_9SPHN|nr:ATPase [Novosphingobium aerophilum]MBC2650817.1 ATPase [Novosphingobium aerophilum]
MTGGKRIVAIGSGGEALPTDEDMGQAAASAADQADQATADWDEPAAAAPGAGRGLIAPVLALIAALGWTGFYLWAEQAALRTGVTPHDAIRLVVDWAVPLLLIGVGWLLVLRTSRREAARFGDAARLLAAESSQLEARLTVVNRELSLAREFIAAQARDLDSLGRMAAERLSEHAGHLQDLIRDNGAQVEAIAGVSTTALDNMERLRGQLPVIASSTKDLANTIGHASNAAQTALDDLIAGFDRLGEASTTNASRVDGLHDRVEASLALFDARLDQIQTSVSARLEMLEHRGTQLRDRLSADESDALAALERRSTQLGDEFTRTRTQLEQHEAEALTSLRARLAALRDEGNALARSLREGESSALTALLAAKDRVEQEIAGVVERLDRLDREALDAATRRIQKLSDEALEFDKRLAERNRLFADEMEQRLAQARERHDAEAARLAGLFRQLDEDLAQRLARQGTAQQELADAAAAITARLEALSERIAGIAAYGNQAEETLGTSLATLTERLAGSREALTGTGGTIAQLTDGAVRLLELLQASTRQSGQDLPAALATGEAGLREWEARVSALREGVGAAEAQGTALAQSAESTRQTLKATMTELDKLQKSLLTKSQDHGGRIDLIRESLAEIGATSDALAERAAGELAAAIASLETAARAAVATLSDETSGAVTAVAERLGEESAAAIDRAMRLRLAEAVGVLEQAASHAAGVSREATIQLRDQLGKVNELTGNLEQRIARARERAEEQVDNDFSRRVALITESLNSNAIDVAKALSTEVTDTSWAAYLKGDRGVFTRRALRLLDATEQREIVRLYEDDQEFRGHVSRYIHDFEAMLRQLLSTRDGHALGVTLLSSDMGKLYVLLAQAIERLRT